MLMNCLLLWREGLQASHVGIVKFIERFNKTGSLSRKPGSGRPSKITTKIKAFVEAKMQKDETTAYQLHAMLRISN